MIEKINGQNYDNIFSIKINHLRDKNQVMSDKNWFLFLFNKSCPK